MLWLVNWGLLMRLGQHSREVGIMEVIARAIDQDRAYRQLGLQEAMQPVMCWDWGSSTKRSL